MHYSTFFSRFMVQFVSASMGESGAVFGIYYAVHECTLPPSFRGS
jgi:hypothetical protein